MYWRFALILLLAPILTAIISFPIVGEGGIVLLMAYPVLLGASLLLAPVVHIYAVRTKPTISRLALLSTFLGLSGAGLITCAIFWDNFNQYPNSTDIAKTALTYGAFGAVHALIILAMYKRGPLRIARAES